LNRSQQVIEIPSPRWKATLSFTNLDESQFASLKQFLMQLHGKGGQFYLYEHAMPNPLGVGTGSPYIAFLENRVDYSEDWQPWTHINGLTVTSDVATAPDGYQTADKLSYTTTTDPHTGRDALVGSPSFRTFTFSVWLWTDSGQQTDYTLYSYANNPFYNDGNISKSITLTTTPTRYWLTKTFGSIPSSDRIHVRIDPPQNPSSSGYCYAWGAQMAELPGLSPYQATDGAEVLAQSRRGVTLPTGGWTPDTTGILQAGDWIGLDGEAKMIVETVNSDSEGLAEIRFEPPLRKAPTAGRLLTVQKVPVLMTLDSNDISWQFTSEYERTLSFTCVESF